QDNMLFQQKQFTPGYQIKFVLEISIIEYNRLKRENEELKRIIGIITLELERGKKIEIVNQSKNKN
ncbi:MAG: hypothetical protein ACPLYC_01700, partial [Minisyncoccia bacterium]